LSGGCGCRVLPGLNQLVLQLVDPPTELDVVFVCPITVALERLDLPIGPALSSQRLASGRFVARPYSPGGKFLGPFSSLATRPQFMLEQSLGGDRSRRGQRRPVQRGFHLANGVPHHSFGIFELIDDVVQIG
jgi:hypothetical protein